MPATVTRTRSGRIPRARPPPRATARWPRTALRSRQAGAGRPCRVVPGRGWPRPDRRRSLRRARACLGSAARRSSPARAAASPPAGAGGPVGRRRRPSGAASVGRVLARTVAPVAAPAGPSARRAAAAAPARSARPRRGRGRRCAASAPASASATTCSPRRGLRLLGQPRRPARGVGEDPRHRLLVGLRRLLVLMRRGHGGRAAACARLRPACRSAASAPVVVEVPVGQAVPDHLEGQEVLALLAQHPAQALHVVVEELAVARGRTLGVHQALALEEADLRDGDVGELLPQQGQDVADGEVGAAAHSFPATR